MPTVCSLREYWLILMHICVIRMCVMLDEVRRECHGCGEHFRPSGEALMRERESPLQNFHLFEFPPSVAFFCLSSCSHDEGEQEIYRENLYKCLYKDAFYSFCIQGRCGAMQDANSFMFRLVFINYICVSHSVWVPLRSWKNSRQSYFLFFT